ncbi:DgyrCDS1100 [Dimorphilus gyrociliatus]|uniref:RNA polymerase II subunit A C-terminal domain phosphatase n=1 Tax=Dimorphilus gyrociliatus TaxID=2664684 RepID=A0A7I8V836_9ANNE|nr:DgyrCDS1100 [Dimorphilus gyrociliatus]
MKGLCADCGIDLLNSSDNPTTSTETATVCMVNSIPELKVSQNRAEILGRKDEKRLLKNRQLVLLVDLDQTLIHTTNDDVPRNLKDVQHFELPSRQAGGKMQWFHSKFRPGTEHFLENMSAKYEMHIATFGVRRYAHTIANLLDPESKYFSHRILSRDECLSQNAKTANLSALFPCGDSLVVIIDDREDVWSFNKNVVKVPAYRFFLGTADINAPVHVPREGEVEQGYLDPSKQSTRSERITKVKKVINKDGKTTEVEEDMIEWEDKDDYLSHLEDILHRIHKRYYDQYNLKNDPIPLTKNIVQSIRAETLRGTRICFSGVFSRCVKPGLSYAYQSAVSLGSVVHNDIILHGDEPTTHLVASKLGTKKVSDAMKSGKIKTVNPNWLYQCADRWQHCDEELFPLNEQTSSDANRENLEATRLAKKKAETIKQQIEEEKKKEAERKRKESESKTDPIFNLCKLSKQELSNMDKEVDDLIDGASSSESDDEEAPTPEEIELKRKVLSSPSVTDSSSDESLSGEYPKGWKRKIKLRRPKCKKPRYDNIDESSSDSMLSDNTDKEDEESEEELGAKMARALLENS